MIEKPCVICPVRDVCIQSITESPCAVSGATEEDTVRCVYKEE